MKIRSTQHYWSLLRICIGFGTVGLIGGCAGGATKTAERTVALKKAEGTVKHVKGEEFVVQVRNLDESTVYGCQGQLRDIPDQTINTGWVTADSKGDIRFVFSKSAVEWDLLVTILPGASSATGNLKGTPLALSRVYKFQPGDFPKSPFIIKLDKNLDDGFALKVKHKKQ